MWALGINGAISATGHPALFGLDGRCYFISHSYVLEDKLMYGKPGQKIELDIRHVMKALGLDAGAFIINDTKKTSLELFKANQGDDEDNPLTMKNDICSCLT
jgi:hypothetical protein